MATTEQLRQQWQPVLKWRPEMERAQSKVLAEHGVWVPLDRMCAHMRIESNGDKNIVSGDGTGHGLFQITDPGFDVDWNRIYNAEYNCYCGAKTLALKYNHCRCGWDCASSAFFAGWCTDMGAIDRVNGTTQYEYAQAMIRYLGELGQLGIGSGTSDPKSQPDTEPSNGSPDGGTNTSTGDNWCLGPVCIPAFSIGGIETMLANGVMRGALVAIGLVVLIIGLKAVV